MKAIITMKNKRDISIELDLANDLFIRDIEGCKNKNQFYKYKEWYINSQEIATIQILEEQKSKPLYTPIPAPEDNLTLEQKQLIKQPFANIMKGVYNG